MTLIHMLVLAGAVCAVCTDVSGGKIPNFLNCILWISGLVLQVYLQGLPGFGIWAAGAALPLVLLFPVFYFRMMGAGDSKLLSALGCLLGAEAILKCLFAALLLGGAFSLLVMLYDASLSERSAFFFSYLADAANHAKNEQGKKKPYLQNGRRPENIHFSVPILMSVMLLAGGMIG